ncbi:protein Mis18-alpha [Exaiptasia diaphana]|uniref:Mis18 domain-containing protein n=1 Tax=Exaiptasia diaphana TaxID=2652724 RepID=A0A913XYI2_EXADI|nr:protein Mis18-alpha [Exaiptasia diaphana]KXJ23776.1 Protein Mis18-alpha [Exaiptasia diaphana]
MAANSTVVDRNEEDDPLDTIPLVFHCVGCRTIIGDSLSWVCADQNLRTVSLSAVTPFVHVATEDGMEISAEGEDLGSTFVVLKCATCQSQIGRIYKTTPKQLDMIRDMYTLDCSSIKSYKLGSNKEKSIKTTEELLEIPTAQTLLSEIVKIQSVVVALSERLCDLENQVNSNKRNDSTSVSPNDTITSTTYTRTRKSSQNDMKRHLNETNQSDQEQGPSKQKRKRVT